MFSITADFDIRDVEAQVEADLNTWFDELIDDCANAAKRFVERIRAKTKPDSFGNITWNLRSSIGYLIVYNGEVIKSYFPVLNTGAEGAKTGEEYAREIALLVNEPEAISTVIVAGMEYAIFVEGRGTDIISHASKDFPKDLIQEFGK